MKYSIDSTKDGFHIDRFFPYLLCVHDVPDSGNKTGKNKNAIDNFTSVQKKLINTYSN